MRKTFSLLGTAAMVAFLAVGCAGPQQKLGRGISNTAEITRGGEFERAVEQGEFFGGVDNGFSTGVVSGVNHTFARTGLGLYEIVTFPLPPYGPVWTSYLPVRPQHPDSFSPRSWATGITDTDHYLGFSGGDIAPWFFGSRFRVFDN